MKNFWYHRLETFSALGVLLWGAFLLNPFVDSFASNRNYTEMAKHATEEAWGSVAVSIGLLGLLGLWLNVRELRQVGTLGAMAFRVFTLVFIGIQTHFANSGTGDFFLWALMAALAYWNIKK